MRLRCFSACLGLALIMGAGTVPVAAQAFGSAYSKLDFDTCTVVHEDEIAIAWNCLGYKGYPVYVADVDLRQSVSYGPNAAHEKAAGQTLSAFNHVNETIEWRLKEHAGKRDPFATILRWFTDDGMGEKGQVLVVTRLGVGNVCQIARIDARKVADANQVARDVADAHAQDFDCATDEMVLIPG